MAKIKEIGWQNNEPIPVTAQTEFASMSQNPMPLIHTSLLCGSKSTTVQPTSEVIIPNLKMLEQNPAPITKHNTISINTKTYVTDKLPGATASHDQHYKTNFDEDIPPLSVEETRQNNRPVLKDNDVDSIPIQNTQLQIIPRNVLPKLPAKAVRSSSVNKSHRSLPHRACLVHLNEQYHLDHDLLFQPRATKYLVKIRTEISPGRYLAKLELHCSR